MQKHLIYLRALAGGFVCLASSTLLCAPPVDSSPAAVDAKGVRHHGNEYHGNPPWNSDVIKAVGFEYSFQDRRNHNQGAGVFRLVLDLKTGRVTNMMILKSTGIRSLDQSALNALRQWRWKPGKWQEVDFPVSFGMASGPAPLPAGAVLLPRK
ncbi:MAG: TonB family protein [Chthoniobacterales bacterium]|nr:TonB family protein [Chthoniobacterales bacterium]